MTETSNNQESAASGAARPDPGEARAAVLLRAVVEASRALLAGSDLATALRGATTALGRHSGFGRVSIFRFDPAAPDPAWYVEAIWEAVGLPRALALYGAGPYFERDFPEVAAAHREGSPWVCHTSAMPPRTQELNRALGVRTRAMVPVLSDESYWGFVCFDNCADEADWSAAEVAALEGVAAAVGAAVGRATDVARRDRLLAATARCAEALARPGPLDANGPEAIAHLLDADGISRVIVGRNEQLPDGEWVNHYLWEAVRPGLPLQKETPGCHPVRFADFPAVVAAMRAGEVVNVRNEAYGAAGRAIQDAVGAKVNLMLPVFVRGEWWGVVGFDNCIDPRVWADAEVDVLRQVTAAVTSALTREQAEADARAAAEARAAELGRANDALRAAITGLSRLDDLDGFLAALLRESLAVAGARNGAFVVLDGGEVDHRVLIEGGEAVPRAVSVARGTARVPLSPEIAALIEAINRSPDEWVIPPDDPAHPPAFRELHRRLGNRALGIVPMRVGERLIGWLGLGFPVPDPPAGQQVTLLRVLAEHATAAVEMHRLAGEARDAAVAREREAAAERRAAELARASDALQAVTDALATARGLGEFVPTVLRIAADTFGAPTASYYDVADDLVVRLRYWLDGGRVYAPGELLALDPVGRTAVPRRLADGFTVSRGYLAGETVLSRTRAVVIDHAAGTDEPEFDEWTRRHGWEMELNVPCVVGGLARGALVLSRPAGRRYTDAEVGLAEALAKQLALAVQTDRLATEARDAAVARGQQAAAERRAAELARANEALQTTVDALSAVGAGERFMPAVLRLAAAAFGTTHAVYYEHLDDVTARPRHWLRDGQVDTLANFPPEAVAAGERTGAARDGFTVPPEYFGESLRARTRVRVIDHRAGTVLPDIDRLAIANGWGVELNVPLVADGRCDGSLVVYRATAFTPDEVALAETLGKQLSLAVRLDRLADARRDAAVAEQRAAELTRLNASLRESVAAVARSTDFRHSLAEVVLRIAESAGARLAHLFLYDAAANTLDSALHVRDGRIHLDRDPTGPAVLQGPFDADVTPAFRQIVDTRDLFVAVEHTALPAAVRDGSWPGIIDWHLARGHRSSCAIPVLAGDRPLGVIGLAWREGVAFAPEQREVLLALSNHAALVIQLWQLEQAAREAAVAGERNRLAGEIHDTLAQGFAGVLTQLAAADGAADDPAATRDHLARARDLARRSLAEARRSVHALRPLPPAARDLPGALAALGRRRAGPPVRVDVTGPPRHLPPSAEGELYRVAQEAVANADRHAAARRIDVSLAFDPDRVVLVVRDDGRGFDPAAVPAGHGLVGMQERMDRAGGSLTVVSEPGRGTEVVAVVPTAGGGTGHG